jgi:hypothetical protein
MAAPNIRSVRLPGAILGGPGQPFPEGIHPASTGDLVHIVGADVPIPFVDAPATLLYNTADGTYDNGISVALAPGSQVNMAYLKLSQSAVASRWLLIFAIAVPVPGAAGTRPIARSAFAVPPGGTFDWEPERGADGTDYFFATSNTADFYTDPGTFELVLAVYGS